MNWAPDPTDNILSNPHVRLVVIGLERHESIPPGLASSPSKLQNWFVSSPATTTTTAAGKPTSDRRSRYPPWLHPQPLPPSPRHEFSGTESPKSLLQFALFFKNFWSGSLPICWFWQIVELLWWKVDLKWAMLVSWLGYFGNGMFGFARCSFEFFSCMKFALNSANFFDLFGWKQCG